MASEARIERPSGEAVLEEETADEEEEENGEGLKHEAEIIAEKVAREMHGQEIVTTVNFLARGGYNSVWLATCNVPESLKPNRFVVRISRDTPSLQPYQVRNEVASLQWVAANIPDIPVPKLYNWSDGTTGSGTAFTAVEYIEGQRLSVAWPRLTEEQKARICRQIANMVANLGETRFTSIGSLTPGTAPTPALGPTVEAAKLFNGRTKIHSPACYDIGPYANSKDYILACYDREIYFYTHADPEDIEDFFEDSTVDDFIDLLKRRRKDLENGGLDTFRQIDSEPLVLVHEDFHAGNMLVRDGKVVGVLDWEFSGVYPLSQLLLPAQILQISMPLSDRDDQTELEEDTWDERFRRTVGEIVKERGWTEKDVQALLSGGRVELRVARNIMFPRPE
ncbi:kinase-like domain-containing protein [Pestalotiopsis sp. NC0098]|nr:kinase-like domain-containing protein [Pestalotiopsis sp. NC0098]